MYFGCFYLFCSPSIVARGIEKIISYDGTGKTDAMEIAASETGDICTADNIAS
jgi:hypothetical protein